MRTPPQKAKSDSNLQAVIQATQKLWRRHYLSYDQTRYVAKEVRRALELGRPQVRTRVIERLSRDEERRLIETAYRLTGTRGLLIKTLFQTGTRVSEFVALEVGDFFFDEQMILIHKAKGGKRRYVPFWQSWRKNYERICEIEARVICSRPTVMRPVHLGVSSNW